jgi:hypothetical protein
VGTRNKTDTAISESILQSEESEFLRRNRARKNKQPKILRANGIGKKAGKKKKRLNMGR